MLRGKQALRFQKHNLIKNIGLYTHIISTRVFESSLPIKKSLVRPPLLSSILYG